jgi:alpha-glucosidase
VSDGGHVWWEDAVVYDCSSAHPLFRAALDAAPGSDERARFIFRDGPENELWM